MKKQPDRLRYANGTPADVKRLIQRLLSMPRLPADLRDVLERFAIWDAMTEFWQKAGTALRKSRPLATKAEPLAFTLRHALEAYERSLHVRDPTVNVARIIEAKVRTIPRLSSDLRNALSGTGDLIPSLWEEIWPGRPEFSFDDLISTLEATSTFGKRLRVKIAEAEAGIHWPKPPKKRLGVTSERVFFSNTMVDFFNKFYGQPRFDLVEVLENVAFDLKKTPVTADTIRKRRRWAEH